MRWEGLTTLSPNEILIQFQVEFKENKSFEYHVRLVQNICFIYVLQRHQTNL